MSALRGIESPVLDLASTLWSQAEEEADADNVSFLRSQVDPQGDWRAQNAVDEMQGLRSGNVGGRPVGWRALVEPSQQAHEQGIQRPDQSTRQAGQGRRESLQRMLERLSGGQPGYSDRVPHQQSLYDWAPGNSVHEDIEQLERFLEMLRRQHPHLSPETSRGTSTSQVESQGRDLPSSIRAQHNSQPDSSLRSAAILQSVRRHQRFSARTREHMQRYVLDRDRFAQDVRDQRDRLTPPSRQREAASTWWSSSRYEQSRLAWQNQGQNQSRHSYDRPPVSAHRHALADYQRQLHDHESRQRAMHRPSPWLEAAIKYLSRLRTSRSYDESLSHAIDANFVTKEFFGDDHENFLLDTADISPPAETSWLVPGTSFAGCQNAQHVVSPGSTSTTYRLPNNQSITSTTLDPGRPWLNHRYQPPSNGGSIWQREQNIDPGTAGCTSIDRWPVRLTLHTINHANMTLSGTMEAFDIPKSSSHHSPVQPSQSGQGATASESKQGITTYLEGEIVDFNRFTLLTESFKAGVSTDAMYWRKLQPFQSFTSDDDLVRHLVSKRWVDEVLFQNYVLMRWKEKCFVGSRQASARVRAAAEGCGLTINGFYYVSLRRSDGHVEGLYFDETSTLYQHLSLDVERGNGFPKWEFR